MTQQISTAHSIVGVSVGRPTDDFYPTPREATVALLDRELFEGVIWEPACGDGAMSKVIEEYYDGVISTDLIDRGYGIGGIDFLTTNSKEVDHIITNPPFSLAQEFVEHALKNTTGKVALLLKLQFLEGQKRQEMFRNTPLKKVYVFSKRLKLSRNGEPQKNSGMICFAWFVWEHGYSGYPMIDWI